MSEYTWICAFDGVEQLLTFRIHQYLGHVGGVCHHVYTFYHPEKRNETQSMVLVQCGKYLLVPSLGGPTPTFKHTKQWERQKLHNFGG